MFQDRLILRTKLAPPRLHRDTLHRERITKRLLDASDYRLTIIQAGAGYGKTTALAELDAEDRKIVWYHLDPVDADPLTFLLHLIYGFSKLFADIADEPLALLESWERDVKDSPWSSAIDTLTNSLTVEVNEPVYVILDDAHYLNDSAETIQIVDYLIGRFPQNIHIILASRYPIKLPGSAYWRVRGEILEINQDELAFTEDETESLFKNRYGLSLTAHQISLLLNKSEGWPIALHLVRQRLRNSKNLSISHAIDQLDDTSSDLFSYLAQEVLAQQPRDIQEFLRTTAILRQMTAATSNCLLESFDSDRILHYLLENDLFVVDLGAGYIRYHHLFRQLLLNQLSTEEVAAFHRRAADCYLPLGEEEEAIYHLLSSEEFERAASILDKLGRSLVRSGRLENLSGWIGALPPDVLEEHPPLLGYLGDIARLKSRFTEALGWYEQAHERSMMKGDVPGVGQALRGQARVYLDTLDAGKAEQLLREALSLSEGQDDRQNRARILELMAENLINRGQIEEAEKYQLQARELREEGPAEAELPVRLLLRTGRLEKARKILESRAEEERYKPVRQPRAHRETPLLLSLVLAFQGDQEGAFYWAKDGTKRGELLESQFITAVGHMRQGHAWLLNKDDAGYANAVSCFQEAITISERIKVPRLKAEANWGLCQVYGLQGDLESARLAAKEGIEIAKAAGDAWLEADIRLAMGAVCTVAERYPDATLWLEDASKAFRECSDFHGETAARLWQCLVWYAIEDNARMARDVEDLLRLIKDNNYYHMFLNKTLLGPIDPRDLVPLLLYARDGNHQASVASNLLRKLGLSDLQFHPGYQLRIQLIGQFRLWRGNQETSADDWRRKKARQLMLFLLLSRPNIVERDQITEILWPELGPEEAQRDFKIAMSALYSVLEPARKRNAPSAYITRDGSRYGWRREADYWLDVEEFETLVQLGDNLFEATPHEAIPHYQRALKLYRGDLLQEHLYEEWTSEERERLLTRYLRTAERVAHTLLEGDKLNEAVDVCQDLLSHDPCWESAYRLMMLAYIKSGQPTQALRVYHNCENKLREELSVEPSPATKQIFHSVLILEKGG